MHELSLAENAIAIIEDVARRECFARVRIVRVELGALSCVEPEALRFAFASASLGSCAEGARLEILAVAGEGLCEACGARAPMETVYDLCSRCGIRPLKVLCGAEMRIRDLDVE